MAKKQTQPQRPSTQKYLDIAEIRDDIVVLKDGSVRAVMLVSSINFALKSADEQQGIIQGYMQFLNGLDYPLQVVVHSRKMQIDDYVARMREGEAQLKNELLRAQMEDYITFIQQLVAGNEIMSKRFYVVVPYDPVSDTKKGFWSRVREALTPGVRVRLGEAQFEKRRHELDQRVAQALGSLGSMGLQGARLDTQGLIELYYGAYNPVAARVQPLQDTSEQQIESSYGF